MRIVLLTVAILLWNDASVAIADFTFNDFSSTSPLNIVGSAGQNGNQMRLTSSVGFQAGGMWFNSQQLVSNGFDTTFQFRVTNSNMFGGNLGADGITFVIQNSSPVTCGQAGGGMGYQGIQNGIAIEFDTYGNSVYGWNDAPANHVSIQRLDVPAPYTPNHAYSLGCTTNIPTMADGNIHTVNIHYLSGLMSITFDNATTPNLQGFLNFENYMTLNNGYAWVGLSAATGGATANQDIVNWSCQSTPEPTTMFLFGLGGLLLRRRKN
jgi:hypothetical protein